MHNFDYSLLEKQTWDSEILNYIEKIHEYKEKQNLYFSQKQIQLSNLAKVAVFQSTESSNSIEGIVTSHSRLVRLLNNAAIPMNEDEEEILGYKDCLDTIHKNYDCIPLESNYILQLHKILLGHTSLSFKGKYKTTPNEIVSITKNGEKNVLFRPLEPFETPGAMERLCATFNKEIELKRVEPLILILNFVLDFLCIHPFNDGNGRISRLLTLLLLNKSGFIVGKYISIEKVIDENKDLYYKTLKESDENWHEEKNDSSYFIKYMLAVILKCYIELNDATIDI